MKAKLKDTGEVVNIINLYDERKRNALAEKILLAMMTNGKWWGMYSKDKEEVMKKCFEWADFFIKESEVNNERIKVL